MSSLIKIDVKKKIANMDMQLDNALKDIVNELSSKALSELQARAPVRTGALRSSFIRTISNDGLSAEIISSSSYIRIVEKGSRPHAIVAKDARALHFFIGDREIFAKSVQHPGTKGRFFIQATLESMRSIASGVAQKYLQDVGKI